MIGMIISNVISGGAGFAIGSAWQKKQYKKCHHHHKHNKNKDIEKQLRNMDIVSLMQMVSGILSGDKKAADNAADMTSYIIKEFSKRMRDPKSRKELDDIINSNPMAGLLLNSIMNVKSQEDLNDIMNAVSSMFSMDAEQPVEEEPVVDETNEPEDPQQEQPEVEAQPVEPAADQQPAEEPQQNTTTDDQQTESK